MSIQINNEEKVLHPPLASLSLQVPFTLDLFLCAEMRYNHLHLESQFVIYSIHVKIHCSFPLLRSAKTPSPSLI